jgi:hypothetical protein
LKIAALYVAENGPYFGLPDVDPWPESRDARKYRGPHAVVAHPPCARWCQLAFIVQKRYGHRVGDDGGCFRAALAAVRRFGGVLEHPAFTHAWKRFGLPRPRNGEWISGEGGWVTQVAQRNYGHAARKLTWLYVSGYDAMPPPPPLDWRPPRAPKAQISFCGNHGDSALPRLSKRRAILTPPAFRDVLLAIARGARA